MIFGLCLPAVRPGLIVAQTNGYVNSPHAIRDGGGKRLGYNRHLGYICPGYSELIVGTWYDLHVGRGCQMGRAY